MKEVESHALTQLFPSRDKYSEPQSVKHDFLSEETNSLAGQDCTHYFLSEEIKLLRHYKFTTHDFLS